MLPFWFADDHILSESSNSRKRESTLSEGPTLMTSIKPNYFSNALSPNAITLRVKTSKYEFRVTQFNL